MEGSVFFGKFVWTRDSSLKMSTTDHILVWLLHYILSTLHVGKLLYLTPKVIGRKVPRCIVIHCYQVCLTDDDKYNLIHHYQVPLRWRHLTTLVIKYDKWRLDPQVNASSPGGRNKTLKGRGENRKRMGRSSRRGWGCPAG